jgi:oligopeptide transport system ATP-binding protein
MSGMPEPMLRVRDLRVDFGAHAAIRDVSFELYAGETVGLVGESGSGKSTLARAILRLVRAGGGEVVWRGRDLLVCGGAELRALRRDLQIVFQDPLASLNPRMTVGDSVAEPLRIFEPRMGTAVRRRRVDEMLERVGLNGDMSRRYPHEFSGGQCQRIGIARAMILKPRLLVCDEPVSSLDVSIQGQIVNLLLDLQRDDGTAMLFISHNLAIVRHLSHRILVMYAGRIVEAAARDALFARPAHPYTRALLASVPSASPRQLAPLDGAAAAAEAAQAAAMNSSASAAASPAMSGCAYRSRCAHAVALCASTRPLLEEIGRGHFAACHRARELWSLSGFSSDYPP